MNFGERIKSTRNQLGLTQETVSKELNVSRQTISSWENERSYPDIESLVKLSEFYQISLDLLLKEDYSVMESIKEKEQLAKLNYSWMISFIINILACVVLSLSSSNSWFAVAEGTRIALIIIILVNIIPLIMYTTEFSQQK